MFSFIVLQLQIWNFLGVYYIVGNTFPTVYYNPPPKFQTFQLVDQKTNLHLNS